MSADETLQELCGYIGALVRRVEEIDNNAAEQAAAANEDRELLKSLIAAQTYREGWQSAKQIADWLGLSEQWVKQNGDILGGERDGAGPTAKWIFKRSRVEAGLPKLRSQAATPLRPATTRRRRQARGDLLPVRDREAA